MIRRRFPILLTLIALVLPTLALAQRTTNLYWAPETVTTGGEQIDGLLNFIFALTAVVFFAVQIVYVYFLIKYRRRKGSKAYYSHGNNFLEIVWTTIPTVIFLGLAIYSNRVWFDLLGNAPDDALPIQVVSYQYGWNFRYAGEDETLGEHQWQLLNRLDNMYGKVANDPTGNDDFETSELVVPVGRPVQIYLDSHDVIHSFYVPVFRLYQDAVPGRTISWVWFEVTKPGNWELACSQLCGSGHYNMKAPIRALPPEEFDAWYKEQSERALNPPQPATPAAPDEPDPAAPDSEPDPETATAGLN